MKITLTTAAFFLMFVFYTPLEAAAEGEGVDVDMESAEGITVTGTRHAKRLKDTSVLSEVISAEEIKNSSAASVTDVLAAYGLVFNEDSTGTSYVSLQGLGENRVLFLIDGRRVTGRFSRRLIGETLPLSNVERIEIVRGPQSALYGSDALGGVINIITKKPRGGFSFGFSITNRFLLVYDDPSTDETPALFKDFDPLREQLLNAGLLFSLGALHNALNIEAARGAFYENEDKSASILPEYYRGKASLSSAVAFESGARLEAGVEGMFLQRTNKTSAAGNLNRTDFLRFGGFGKFSFLPFTKGSITITLSEDFYSRDRDNYSAAIDVWDKKASFDNENLAALEIAASYEGFENWLLSGGVEGSFNNMQKSNLTKSFVFRDREALFLEGEYFKRDKFSITAGLRAERDSSFGFAFSPKLSAMRHFGGVFRLLGGAGLGYRAPDFTDLYMDGNASESHRVSGNPNLKPEWAVSANAALEYSQSGRFAWLNFYYSELWGEVLNAPTVKISGRQYYERQNKNRTLRLGVDSEGRVNLPFHLFVSAGYGWLFAYDREAEEQFHPHHSHTIKAKLGFDIKKPVGIYAYCAFRFFSAMPEEDYTERRYFFDFYSSWTITKWLSLNFSIDNISGEMLTTRMASVNAPRFSLGIKCSF